MTNTTVALDEIRRVTDHELMVRLRGLVRADRTLTARLLVHLGEVDARGLYREDAFSSMFTYCVEGLRMSEAQAYLRIHAARLVRQFPRVLQLVSEGALHLTAIKLLGPHLTASNHVELLERARGKNKRGVELLVAEIAPKPDVPSRMRKLPEPRSAHAARQRDPRAPTQLGAKEPPLPAAMATLETTVSSAHGDARQAPISAAREITASSAHGDARQAWISDALDACQTTGSFAPSNARQAPISDAFDPCHTTASSVPSNARQAPISDAFDPCQTTASSVPRNARQAPNSDAFDPCQTTVSSVPSNTRQAPISDAIDAYQTIVSAAPSPAPQTPGSDALDARHTTVSSAPSAATEGPVSAVREACYLNRAPFALRGPRARGAFTPLRPGRYKIEFTAGLGLRDKLTRVRDLLRHQVPDGDLAVLVERAVDLLIEDTLKKRFAQTRAPKARRSTTRRRARQAKSRYVPRSVVREVHARDAGQCTFVSSDGSRCCERGFLELHHHRHTYARGGDATVENLRLVCRAHNALLAERDYGRAFMRSKLTRTRTSSDEPGPERVPSLIPVAPD